MQKTDKNEIIGAWYGVAAYILWGLLPLYWKLLTEISAEEILAHRIFWSFIFVGVILLFSKELTTLKKAIKDKKSLFLIALCAVIITLNWGTYIWAVNSDQVVEASMGYYINPLIVVLLGMIVLKEKFNLWQCVAIILAAIGVIVMTVQYGKIPWIALTLALTFSFYGLLKKLTNVGSIIGLALETTIIMPVALMYILFKQMTGIGALGNITLLTTFFLFGSGIATATPLLLFAKAAKRIRLSTIGFLQYIAPTISLFLGVVIFNEPFTKTHLVSFGFIWVALVIYSLSNISLKKKKIQPVLVNSK